ncbi:MAG: hypothetical protein ACPG05_04980 [Bdellovibrionales bacterium]
MLKTVVLLSFVGMVSACGAPKKHASIVEALPPPNFDSADLSNAPDPLVMERMQAYKVTESGLPEEGNALEVSKVLKKCRLKDRFDRKSVFAYHWSPGEKLSLDVDGLNMGSQKIDRVYLQYKVSLQPELEKRDHCKYASSYQGIVGSAYNEFVLREDDTVWQELDYLQAEVGNTISALVE